MFWHKVRRYKGNLMVTACTYFLFFSHGVMSHTAHILHHLPFHLLFVFAYFSEVFSFIYIDYNYKHTQHTVYTTVH